MKDDAVAVIGLACRFPGAPDARAFWKLLANKIDAITEVPKDRWDADAYYDPAPATPGKMYTRWGGFLENIDQFDPQFFGLSPREAETMDPQQRLILEVAYESLQDAGIPISKLKKQQGGVFVGVQFFDYFHRLATAGATFDAYTATGNAHSVIANRLSYLLDLRGPSLAVDTACSSSLVAVHNACVSLLSGESNVAIAGGVNLILSPEVTVALSQARMMAPDGRCKTFDARADGYVRSEGCGVVILKRLSDALKDRDSIWAVLRGTAVNHVGRSNGLTAPSGPAQEAVIERALARAGVSAAEIGYVEAHGTGTSLGDPIEIEAIGRALGRDRKRPLLVGSAKTNIGHLESASGMAGLIKVILSLHEGAIPANVHLSEENPKLGLSTLPIELPRQLVPWSRTQTPRIAGVSSFGFGGANAHVIVQESPDARVTAFADRPSHVLALSGRTAELIQDEARALAERIALEPELEAADLCFTRNIGRDQQLHRTAIVARSLEELETSLLDLSEGASGTNTFFGQRRMRKLPKIAFLYAGQGSQAHGMGRALFEGSPVFRAAMERCAALADRALKTPLLQLLYGPVPDPEINQTSNAQIALFAFEYALTAWWKSLGVVPDVVLGHSLGEIVAATTAGVLDLESAIALVLVRGRLMQECGGKMSSVFAPPSVVEEALGPDAAEVNIAAINEPEHVVISGSAEGVARVTARLETLGRVVRPLKVSGAFHSPEMDPVLPRFSEALANFRFHAPALAWVSNLSGEVQSEAPDPSYWVRHVRSPVRFASAMTSALALEPAIFVEIGASNTLTALGKRCLPEAKVTWLASLNPKDEWNGLASAVSQLWAGGVDLDWERWDRAEERTKLRLPPLPYQRGRFWFTPGVALEPAAAFQSIAERIRARASSSPDAIALGAGHESLSYRELMERVAGLEAKLRAANATPGGNVVLFGEPSPELVIGLLATLGAGFVAVPIVPSEAGARIGKILGATEPVLLLTERQYAKRFAVDGEQMFFFDDVFLAAPAALQKVAAEKLAMILHPRSASSAEELVRVEVSEKQAAAFFRSLAGAAQEGAPLRWNAAATDPGEQSSMLQLLFGLTRGDELIFAPQVSAPAAATDGRELQLSLLYFAQEERDNDHYRLLLEGARFADRHGFAAVWTQEQHFHEIGGAYPNPSITAAAVAAITQRVAVRGSVLLPLHHPIRVAEEWAMIDRLSAGRVGVAFDSGLYPNDFVFDSSFSDRRETLLKHIALIQKSWSGAPITAKNADGNEVSVEVHPRPVQPALPHWLSAGCEDGRYVMAAELGAKIIVPLAAMRFDDLERRIALYRAKWREHGHAGEGHVTVIMHVFIGDDVDEVRELVRGPMTRQLKLSARRLAALDKNIQQVDEENLEQFAKITFEQHFEKGGLFGTPETALKKVEAFKAIGVDEIACLIDYGVPADVMLASLPRLAKLRRLANPRAMEREGAARLATASNFVVSTPAPEVSKPVTPAPAAAPSRPARAPRPTAAAAEAYAAPTNDTERILAEIYCAVLKLPKVGINDNFFAIGGDSRLGIEIVTRAKNAGLAIEVLQVFEHPTIAELAATVPAPQPAR